jgi:hypothetical protein
MLATMTRGDAVGLIPMILLLCPGWWRPGNLMYAVLAALPLAVWTLLGQTSSAFHYAQIIEPSRILDASGWLSCVQTAIWPIPAVWPLAVAFWVLVALSTRWTWSLACFALPYCLIHASYPYQEFRMWVPVGWALVLMAGVGWSYVYAHRPTLSVLALAGVIGLSMLTLAPRVMQYGARDQEFKQLADWAKVNVKPGEKVATTMWSLLNLTTDSDTFVPADAKCAAYVCWDSRLGAAVDKDVWKVKQMDSLSKPKSQAGYVYVVSFVNMRDRSKYVNVFRVK